ncbi:MAG: hypothetical protein AAB352_02700 [Patescibacteria group bacterium]
MKKSNKYENYTKEELVNELETLKKKKYGLVWDKKNSQEMHGLKLLLTLVALCPTYKTHTIAH